MTIELSPEHDRLIEALIEEGRFSSPSEVVTAGLEMMQPSAAWTAYAQGRIDAGAKALQENDFASDGDVDALFAKHRRPAA